MRRGTNNAFGYEVPSSMCPGRVKSEPLLLKARQTAPMRPWRTLRDALRRRRSTQTFRTKQQWSRFVITGQCIRRDVHFRWLSRTVSQRNLFDCCGRSKLISAFVLTDGVTLGVLWLVETEWSRNYRLHKPVITF